MQLQRFPYFYVEADILVKWSLDSFSNVNAGHNALCQCPVYGLQSVGLSEEDGMQEPQGVGSLLKGMGQASQNEPWSFPPAQLRLVGITIIVTHSNSYTFTIPSPDRPIFHDRQPRCWMRKTDREPPQMVGICWHG